MSVVYNKIKEDIKTAMRAKSENLIVLRSLDAAIYRKAKDDLVEIDDNLVLSVIEKGIKQFKESIDIFGEGNRLDLVEKEKFEMSIYQSYLPPQLTKDQIDTIISDAFLEVSGTKSDIALTIKDMGAINKIIMSQIRGRADSKMVSNIVKDLLTKP